MHERLFTILFLTIINKVHVAHFVDTDIQEREIAFYVNHLDRLSGDY